MTTSDGYDWWIKLLVATPSGIATRVFIAHVLIKKSTKIKEKIAAAEVPNRLHLSA
jgi:hypothetical protein